MKLDSAINSLWCKRACVLHVHSGSCPREFFMLYRGDDPIQGRSTKNRPVFGLGSSFGEPQVKESLRAQLAITL
jgi:hypothetical protein